MLTWADSHLKRKLLDILACPIDKYYPLVLSEFNADGDKIVDGMLLCTKCDRFYPIIEEIPIMLPDELRNRDEDLAFLQKWASKLPERVVYEGKPVHLERLGSSTLGSSA